MAVGCHGSALRDLGAYLSGWGEGARDFWQQPQQAAHSPDWLQQQQHFQDQENKAWNMKDLVTAEGYPLEEHTVTTRDGYILRLFRIPHGANDTSNARRPVVLFQHALLDCSCSWVNNGASRSLGFIMADQGFDAWFANSRGNTYGRNHTKLAVSDPEFWRFSFDEMALEDLPATIDYVLGHTKQDKLVYVGHSQGTTVGFAAFSTLPEMEDKVSLAVMMAPAVFLQHVRSKAALQLAKFEADQLFLLAGAREFLPSMSVLQLLFGSICATKPGMCANVLSLLCGYNPDNINQARLGVYLSYTPAGTSVQNMAHWAQLMREKKTQPRFQRYDYGTSCRSITWQAKRCNQKVYGQVDPPQYDLHRIRVPLAIVTGSLDQLSDEDDITQLYRNLRSKSAVYTHNEPTYEHLDFTWGWNAAQLIYPPLVQLMKDYAGLLPAQ